VTLRIQLCGAFVVEMDDRRITPSLGSRQTRLLFAALWGDMPPASANAALSVLISKLRTAIGPDLVSGRAEIALVLPEGAEVDVEIALAELHSAESAVVTGDWPRAWFAALSALFIARRPLLPGVSSP
jgi:hypothetical protein